MQVNARATVCAWHAASGSLPHLNIALMSGWCLGKGGDFDVTSWKVLLGAVGNIDWRADSRPHNLGSKRNDLRRDTLSVPEGRLCDGNLSWSAHL